MLKFLKKNICKILNLLHIDLTKNLKYDRLTKAIIKKEISFDSVCIDVGCHKGEILDIVLKYAINGGHYGFEPIPDLYNILLKKYSKNNIILPYALSDKEGITTFQYVRNAPAFSGIKKRKYEIKNPRIEQIDVQLKTLDSIIPDEIKLKFIKIDVEGGELGVLKGAEKVIKMHKPLIIFECGLGASEFYGTKPEDVYEFLVNKINFKLTLLQWYLKNRKPLSIEQFCKIYYSKSDYYFVSYP